MTSITENSFKSGIAPVLYDVRDYGAKGDGVTDDTKAIQQTIDLCNREGGGIVRVPEGVYPIRPIQLRSNIRLHLEKGALLQGSPRHEDYPEWESRSIHAERAAYNAKYLIVADGEENISITGEGTIEGRAEAFYEVLEENTWWRIMDKATRPGRMIWFIRCRNVRIEGNSYLNAPAWTFMMIACEDLVFHNVHIRTPYWAINTDGIDIVSSRNVRITNCDIRTGDDAIILRAVDRLFEPNEPPACEQVHVENCTLASNCQAIRLSYIRDGVIRNVTMNNLTIKDSRRGIICQIPSPEETPEGRNKPRDGRPLGAPVIENVVFSNIRIDALMPLWFYLSDTGKAGRFQNIRFENLYIEGTATSILKGTEETPMQNFSLKNVYFHMKDGEQMSHTRPAEAHEKAVALACYHCENLSLDNIITEGDQSEKAQTVPMFHFESVQNLKLDGVINRSQRATGV